jgi:hypothetical protein
MTQLGKYSSDRDNILHYMATSDWANDSFGDVEAPTGYVWRMSNDLQDVQLANTELTSLIEDQLEAYDIEDGPQFRNSLVGHFLITENDQGAVSVQKFDTESELFALFVELRHEYSKWEGYEDG